MQPPAHAVGQKKAEPVPNEDVTCEMEPGPLGPNKNTASEELQVRERAVAVMELLQKGPGRLSPEETRDMRRKLHWLVQHMHFEPRWLASIEDHAIRATILAPFAHLFAHTPQAAGDPTAQDVALLQASHLMSEHFLKAALEDLQDDLQDDLQGDVPEPRLLFADEESSATTKLLKLLDLERTEMYDHWFGISAQWDLLLADLKQLLDEEHGGVWRG